MERQEAIMRLNMMQQESQKLEEHIQVINQQMQEFEVLKLSLTKLDIEKETLVNLGKGVFGKAKLVDKELFVNIGKDVVLKKTPEETLEIINRQMMKLREIKADILGNIEQINKSLAETVEELQKSEE